MAPIPIAPMEEIVSTSLHDIRRVHEAALIMHRNSRTEPHATLQSNRKDCQKHYTAKSIHVVIISDAKKYVMCEG